MTHDLIDPYLVTDRQSFVRFVQALSDREEVENSEKADPKRYQWDGANDWQNGSISTFLESALAGAEAQDKWGNEAAPSWKDLAVFLYLGKIYE